MTDSLKHFLMNHCFLMVCIVGTVMVYSHTACSAADVSVQKDAGFGMSVDVRSIDREPDQETFLPVKDRSFPDFAPKGLIVGKLLVLPSAGVNNIYNDNLFATDIDEVSDYAVVLAPAIAIRTLKDRHFLGMSLESEIVRYIENTNENVENFDFNTGGYFELKHDLLIPWNASYVRSHQDRANNLSRVFTKTPLEISELELEVGMSYKPNRLGFEVLGRHIKKYFEDGISLLDSTKDVIRSDSNFNTNEIELEAGYEFSANHMIFLKGGFGETRYAKGIYDDGAAIFTDRVRDSVNTRVLAGIVTQYKGLISSDISAGYAHIDFNDSTLSDVENIAVDANIDWNVTKLSTLGLNLTRSIVQDNEIVQGIVQTQGILSFDHELRRQLILSASGTYINRDFDNISREDDIYRLGLGFLYRPSPYYTVQGDYIHSQQDSTFVGNEFDRNLLMLRLIGHY